MNIQQALDDGIIKHHCGDIYKYIGYDQDTNGDIYICVFQKHKYIECYGYQDSALYLTFEEVIRLGKFLEQLET